MVERKMIFGKYVVYAERFFLGTQWSFYKTHSGTSGRVCNGELKSYWVNERTGTVLRSSGDAGKGGISETKQVNLEKSLESTQSGPVYGDGAA